jgi:tetratricopeptide (TPR) repeat protein
MDDLDRLLSDALGSQRLPDHRAAAMARRATRRPIPRWIAGSAAAAALLLIVAAGFLGGPVEAQAYSVVTRLDQVHVVAQRRLLPDDYEVTAGEYITINHQVAGPGSKIKNGKITSGTVASDFIIGLKHFAAEQWDEAAAALAKVATPDGRFYHVAALGRGRRLAEAVSAADAYLTTDAAHAGADLVRYFRALYLRELGKGDAALLELRGTLKGDLADLVEAQTGSAAWERFQKAWSERHWSAALAALEGVKSGDAAFYRIACVANGGDELRAIALTDEFVRQWPAHSACDYALYFKAVYLGRLGRVVEARAACKLVLERYPNGGMGAHTRALLEDLR